MVNLLRKLFRFSYYFIYGKSGKKITIDNEEYTISAYVARGVSSSINETPLKLLMNLVTARNTDILFDVGGNIGVISLILANKMKPGSVIYSFEPAPVSFKYLKDTARVQKGNARIIPVNNAVSNNDGKLYFTNDGNSCTNHIAAEQEAGTISVDCITIDSFCAASKVMPQVMKIDIEGAEYWALDGMRQMLKDNNCYVLVEIHSAYLIDNNITGKLFGSLVDAIGYKVYNESGAVIKSDEIMNNSCVILAKETLPAKIFQV